MADGEVKVTLDAETERRLKAAAEAAGRSVGDHARALIREGLDDSDWTEDLRIAEDAERTGSSYSVEDAVAHFRTALHAQVKKAR